MNIVWIIDRDCIPVDEQDPENIKNIGPTWSSWHAWRSWNTDNVLAYDFRSCQDLVRRGYHRRCNLYVPETHFSSIGRPSGINLYQGEFNVEFEKKEEVMSMMLAAANNDIILLLGFDFSFSETLDSYQKHQTNNYLNSVKRAILSYPDRQWVLVDPVNPADKRFDELSNLVADTRENVLKLLS